MFAAVAITLIGANWGLYEAWNPDQMGFRCLTCVENQPLNPGWFLKPPFFSYLVLVFAKIPASLLEAALNLDSSTGDMIALLLARTLNALLFALTCAVGYAVLKPVAGLWPARLFAVALATSAGFVAFAHFLTTEISVTLFMLIAFWFSARILHGARLADYVAAGFIVGVATATKYNGLAVGIGIPIAHILALRPGTLRELISAGFDHRLILGVAAVIPGFVFANPYALLDYPQFTSDFLYNYVTTPVYSGMAEGNSYLDFLAAFVEIFGWPLCLVITAGVFLIAVGWARGQFTRDQKHLVVLLSGTFLLYFYKFGSFPRFETRFALPVAPLVLMLAMVPLRGFQPGRLLAVGFPIAAYGVLCGTLVGLQFRADPRMDAIRWAKTVPREARVEKTSYTPDFSRSPGFEAVLVSTPWISGRVRLLSAVAEDLDVGDKLRKSEREEQIDWYSEAALYERRPDFIALNSLYYKRFFSAPMNTLYPELQDFYSRLLDEEFCYRTVFDQQSSSVPKWAYPQRIDFLKNRMVIQELDEACFEAGA